MMNIKLKSLLLVLVALAGLHSGAAQTCNEHGFLCSGSDKYKLCIDGGAPIFEATCEKDTFCYTDCAIECSTRPCARCNSAGYHCLNDTHFQVCNDGSNLPEPEVLECPEGSGTKCSKNCNTQAICTPNICPATCSETTRLPVPGNQTAYYLCEVDETGGVKISSYVCPPGTEYNADIKSCSTPTTTEPTTTTTTTQPTTTPLPEHLCTRTGRFANPANCSKYHLCLAVTEGNLTKYNYDCAVGSYFHPSTSKCSPDPSVCGSTPRNLVFSDTASECLSDDQRYEDPSSCYHYFICSWSDEELVSYRHACPLLTVFSPAIGQCTAQDNYPCDN